MHASNGRCGITEPLKPATGFGLDGSTLSRDLKGPRRAGKPGCGVGRVVDDRRLGISRRWRSGACGRRAAPR
jgi:hypothetical protein